MVIKRVSIRIKICKGARGNCNTNFLLLSTFSLLFLIIFRVYPFNCILFFLIQFQLNIFRKEKNVEIISLDELLNKIIFDSFIFLLLIFNNIQTNLNILEKRNKFLDNFISILNDNNKTRIPWVVARKGICPITPF